MRHKRFPIDELTVAGRAVSVRYCDLLVAVNEESTDTDWECLAASNDEVQLTEGTYLLELRSGSRSFDGDAILVALRRAGPRVPRRRPDHRGRRRRAHLNRPDGSDPGMPSGRLSVVVVVLGGGRPSTTWVNSPSWACTAVNITVLVWPRSSVPVHVKESPSFTTITGGQVRVTVTSYSTLIRPSSRPANSSPVDGRLDPVAGDRAVAVGLGGVDRDRLAAGRGWPSR